MLSTTLPLVALEMAGHMMGYQMGLALARTFNPELGSQTEILVLDSPFVANAQFDAMVSHFNAEHVTIDCTFPAGGKQDALREGLAPLR